MYANRVSGILLALTTVGATCSIAQALPNDRTIRYTIYEDRYDSESDVAFTVDLSVSAESKDGNDIGWEVTQIRLEEFREVDGNRVWTEDWPTLYTADGLWWVGHADPDDPQISEFDMPPLLDATAEAQDPSYANLDYYLEGVHNNALSATPFTNTVGLDFEFTLVGEEDPIEEGDDEPVEPDEDGDVY
ncbi:MAG: hypothetical protein ACYSUI_00380 [Planctomycetota bacterium]|jgi:hypothetical protein